MKNDMLFADYVNDPLGSRPVDPEVEEEEDDPESDFEDDEDSLEDDDSFDEDDYLEDEEEDSPDEDNRRKSAICSREQQVPACIGVRARR